MTRTAKEAADLLAPVYSSLVQEASARVYADDKARIKAVLELCYRILTTGQGEEIDTTLKMATEALEWLQAQPPGKLEDGAVYPAEAYLITDGSPADWKYRLWESPELKTTRKQLNIISAMFSPGGYKGARAIIPAVVLESSKRRVRAEYRNLKIDENDIPKWVKEAEMRELLRDLVPLTEAAVATKGKATVTVIKPGFNVGKGRFYPKETLARDFGIFEGVKMYADHPTEGEEKARPERSIRDYVATLSGVKVAENGDIIGEATIVEPWFNDKLNLMRERNVLPQIGVSINAIGSASDATVEGTKTKMIEKLIKARSVDFVTEAGAGGGVMLFESADPNTDIDLIGIDALKEKRADLVEIIESAPKAELAKEVKARADADTRAGLLEAQIVTLTATLDTLKAKVADADKAKTIAEVAARINEAVAKSELPAPSKARLLNAFKGRDTDEGLAEAIKYEIGYIMELNEAGKVKGFGGTKPNFEQDRAALKAGFKDLHPEWSEKELEAATSGK